MTGVRFKNARTFDALGEAIHHDEFHAAILPAACVEIWSAPNEISGPHQTATSAH
jgi:hypothetical protein